MNLLWVKDRDTTARVRKPKCAVRWETNGLEEREPNWIDTRRVEFQRRAKE